mgnify:CR=1 FL=1
MICWQSGRILSCVTEGGNNAGHTVVTKQGKFILNLLPSGILHPNVVCVLADGMVVDLEHLSNEIADIRGKGVSVTPQKFSNCPLVQPSPMPVASDTR